MLDALKRMMSRDPAFGQWREIEDWSRERGFGFRRARDDAGFVVDGSLNGKPWRLEWGPARRDYMPGPELRIRMPLGLRKNAQMLILSWPLMQELERLIFERFTDGTQTQIDSTTPEEMRWLAMFPKFGFSPGSTLAARIGAVGRSLAALSRWLDGPLSQQIETAGNGVLSYPTPFVLMTLRGRVSLRLGLATPGIDAIVQSLALFAVAVDRALHIADPAESGTSVWPTTPTSVWGAPTTTLDDTGPLNH